eukprot:11671029-Alexandrium_andersonii.AAC.1
MQTDQSWARRRTSCSLGRAGRLCPVRNRFHRPTHNSEFNVVSLWQECVGGVAGCATVASFSVLYVSAERE